MSKKKLSYSQKELLEFKNIILDKIQTAKSDLELLRSSYANDADNGTDDTSPTFKAFEEGSSTLSKDENMKLALRQEKFIKSLDNALIRRNGPKTFVVQVIK